MEYIQFIGHGLEDPGFISQQVQEFFSPLKLPDPSWRPLSLRLNGYLGLFTKGLKEALSLIEYQLLDWQGSVASFIPIKQKSG